MIENKSCKKAISIKDTFVETVYHILPMYSNPYGALHGGMALNWILTNATMSAMRASRRPTVVARLDHTFFINPIKIGQNAILYSWIDYAGRSSLEATVVMESEDSVSGKRRLTTLSYVILVSVDDNLRPLPHYICIQPRTDLERRLYEQASARKERREKEIANRRKMIEEIEAPVALDENYHIVSYRYAYPEDAVFHNAFFAGKLMYYMDELAGILGTRYSKGAVVTASVDATNFYAPIKIGDVIEMHASLSYVGRSSMEITIKVIARNEVKGIKRHTTTSYFTLVAVDEMGKPRKVSPFEPKSNVQRDLFQKALKRKRIRENMLKTLKDLEKSFDTIKELHKL